MSEGIDLSALPDQIAEAARELVATMLDEAGVAGPRAQIAYDNQLSVILDDASSSPEHVAQDLAAVVDHRRWGMSWARNHMLHVIITAFDRDGLRIAELVRMGFGLNLNYWNRNIAPYRPASMSFWEGDTRAEAPIAWAYFKEAEAAYDRAIEARNWFYWYACRDQFQTDEPVAPSTWAKWLGMLGPDGTSTRATVYRIQAADKPPALPWHRIGWPLAEAKPKARRAKRS
ncbi:hypothetical protein GCM10022221_67640 [Actinocorallia aurea]